MQVKPASGRITWSSRYTSRLIKILWDTITSKTADSAAKCDQSGTDAGAGTPTPAGAGGAGSASTSTSTSIDGEGYINLTILLMTRTYPS